eukprot:9046109-Lingulodinium_polyedra.AAC.1
MRGERRRGRAQPTALQCPGRPSHTWMGNAPSTWQRHVSGKKTLYCQTTWGPRRPGHTWTRPR